jgi:tetratricopeptide (TPR) repeat protein
VLLLAVLAFALLSGGDGGGDGGGQTASEQPRQEERQRQRERERDATPTASPDPTPEATEEPAPEPQPAPQPQPEPQPQPSGEPNLDRAADLQLQGFNARQAGDNETALRRSQQALEACGSERPLSPCGYALFEVGRALNRLGRPAEAIPYLEERVAYGDGSQEAQSELEDAQSQAGGGDGGSD